MTMELESMAVEMPFVKGHPNRAGFRGVLTVVDLASQRAPSGSRGKRVLLTRAAAEKALPSLIGMAVDYAPSFDRHDTRRKVGLITRAEVVGRNLEVEGYLYAKDFPEVVEEIARCGGRPGRQALGVGHQASATDGMRLRSALAAAVKEIRGMIGSSEKPRSIMLRAETPLVLCAGTGESGLGMSFEVTKVRVVDERARTWVLSEVTFTGAAVLRRDKAAFQETWIELSS